MILNERTVSLPTPILFFWGVCLCVLSLMCWIGHAVATRSAGVLLPFLSIIIKYLLPYTLYPRLFIYLFEIIKTEPHSNFRNLLTLKRELTHCGIFVLAEILALWLLISKVCMQNST